MLSPVGELCPCLCEERIERVPHLLLIRVDHLLELGDSHLELLRDDPRVHCGSLRALNLCDERVPLLLCDPLVKVRVELVHVGAQLLVADDEPQLVDAHGDLLEAERAILIRIEEVEDLLEHLELLVGHLLVPEHARHHRGELEQVERAGAVVVELLDEHVELRRRELVPERVDSILELDRIERARHVWVVREEGVAHALAHARLELRGEL